MLPNRRELLYIAPDKPNSEDFDTDFSGLLPACGRARRQRPRDLLTTMTRVYDDE